jgi:CubicO group peptidase (beta-lactamase class C family)
MNTDDGNSERPTIESRSDNADQAGEIMRAVAASSKIPGMSLAIATPERLLYAGAVGYADLDEGRASSAKDQYPWFSMTKIATATTAIRLHADGILDLDAPIDHYLSGYRGSDRHGHPTTRHLLTHTAGLGNPLPIRWVRRHDQPEDPSLLGEIITKHGTPKRTVGSRASYSNIGYLLAGEVIASASGRTLEECVRASVLDPLGMTETGYRYHPGAPRAIGYVRAPRALVPVLRAALPRGLVGARVQGHTALHQFLVSGAAYGGLVGNVADAVRLAAAHAADTPDPHPLLAQPHLDAMRAITERGKPFDHGVGWFRKPDDAQRTPAFVEHYGTGGGHWNAMRIYPELRLALVAMTNTTYAWDADRLFTLLKDLPWN